MKNADTKEASPNKLDVEIGRRLNQFRKSLPTKHSQASFGYELGITQTTLSLYELGKSPIPRGVKTLLEKQFGMNLVWLETGNGKMFQEDIVTTVQSIFPKLNENNRKLVLSIIKQTYVAQCHQEELDSL